MADERIPSERSIEIDIRLQIPLLARQPSEQYHGSVSSCSPLSPPPIDSVGVSPHLSNLTIAKGLFSPDRNPNFDLFSEQKGERKIFGAINKSELVVFAVSVLHSFYALDWLGSLTCAGY